METKTITLTTEQWDLILLTVTRYEFNDLDTLYGDVPATPASEILETALEAAK